MPTINPSLVPTIAPGNLFAALTGDSTLNVRWITPTDPVYYESVNRPIADVVLRQLILAKTLDQLSVSIGHQAIFPFLIQAKVISATSEVDLPYGWIWDLHISAPAKWNNFRLAKIKRLNGEQAGTGDYTGVLRLIFTAAQSNTSSDQPIDTATEVAIFYADYVIDSLLTYQRSRIVVIDSTEAVTIGIAAINPGEKETINGFVTFRTLIQSDPIVQTFYNAIPYVTPPGNIYPIASTAPNGFDDFSTLNVVHGTGILVDSCYNAIPQMDSDAQTWLNAFNYPFEISSTRTSSTPITVTIPLGLFNEFNIVAPASDQPTGDTSGLYYPVWISRIQTIGTKADRLLFYFSTYNTTQAPSTDPIEFATLELSNSMVNGEIVAIKLINNLLLQVGTSTGSAEEDLYQQGFGKGHVMLSNEWSGTGTVIDDFFNCFAPLLADEFVYFVPDTTRISSFGVSRVPKYAPTLGQSQAMVGTTERLTIPIPPSGSNRFVTEQDQGLGNTIDLDSQQGITPVSGISKYGNTGGLVRKTVQLCIDYTKLPVDTNPQANTFYVEQVLPRLMILLDRSPVWGDEWYNGTTFLRFNGDTWQSI